MLEFLKSSLKVTRRHWLVYRKDFLANISPTLFDPLMFLLAFGFGLGSHISEVNNLDYFQYMAPGLALSTALFTAFFEMSYNFYVRYTYEGIYKAILTTPIQPREIIAGEFLWVGTKGALMSFAISIVLWAVGAVHGKYIVFIPLLGAIVSFTCGALGLIANSFIRNINQFQAVYAFFISPLYFFSGAFYPIDNMPDALRVVTYLSPMYHGVKMGQSLLWGQQPDKFFLLHLVSLLLMMVVLVSFATRRIQPKLRH
ncbi:MAG: ABC transporter permease [Oligoflexales bacterium]